MTESWYRFEPHGNTEVTLFSLGGEQARTGTKGTRFFKKHIVGRADAEEVVRAALARMPAVRADWPPSALGRPAGLKEYEHEIVFPALMLATGWPKADVDRIIRSGGEPV